LFSNHKEMNKNTNSYVQNESVFVMGQMFSSLSTSLHYTHLNMKFKLKFHPFIGRKINFV